MSLKRRVQPCGDDWVVKHAGFLPVGKAAQNYGRSTLCARMSLRRHVQPYGDDWVVPHGGFLSVGKVAQISLKGCVGYVSGVSHIMLCGAGN